MDDTFWYNEAIGKCFYAWCADNTPNFYYVGIGIFVHKSDCEIIKR